MAANAPLAHPEGRVGSSLARTAGLRARVRSQLRLAAFALRRYAAKSDSLLASMVGSLLLCGSALAAQADSVVFRDAWFRAPLPGASVTAAYCDVENRGDSAATLVRFGASTDDDLKVEMHETVRSQDGDGMEMVRMRHLQEVEVPPRATVALAPGGRHLMLFGAPEAHNLTLQASFADGSAREVVFERRTEGSP